MTGADNKKAGANPARPPKSSGENERDARLKAALKANMARRKAQARARTAQPDEGAGSIDNDKNE